MGSLLDIGPDHTRNFEILLLVRYDLSQTGAAGGDPPSQLCRVDEQNLPKDSGTIRMRGNSL